MSLKEAYSLTHTAQCRLHLAASRPDRNLRFVVGHLLHYESLRLRIVEIEHDISKSQRASAVAFKGTGHVDHRLQRKPSTGNLGRKSPPPPPRTYEDQDTDEDTDEDNDDEADDEEDEGNLSLERFPSASVRPPRPPPDLIPDDPAEVDDDFDEPLSPEEPDQETLEKCLTGDGSEIMATMYEGVRNCVCHGRSDAPAFERMWELPPEANTKEGVTRAVAQVSGEMHPQMSCTEPIAM